MLLNGKVDRDAYNQGSTCSDSSSDDVSTPLCSRFDLCNQLSGFGVNGIGWWNRVIRNDAGGESRQRKGQISRHLDHAEEMNSGVVTSNMEEVDGEEHEWQNNCFEAKVELIVQNLEHLVVGGNFGILLQTRNSQKRH